MPACGTFKHVHLFFFFFFFFHLLLRVRRACGNRRRRSFALRRAAAECRLHVSVRSVAELNQLPTAEKSQSPLGLLSGRSCPK
jgi:hypothetical protein